jgi:nicotinate-nucleotide pyrophosphorylase (carboxylating)
MDWTSSYVASLVEEALREDIGTGDLAVAVMVPAGSTGVAKIVAEQDLVVAGLPLAAKVFGTLDANIHLELCAQDGETVRSGQVLLRVHGKVAAILSGERTALNFLRGLSGIATLTRSFVELVAGIRARICGAEEMTPGLQLLEEYAVGLGGGGTARNSAADQVILLTGKHVVLAGGVTAAVDQAHSHAALRARPRALTAYESVGNTPAAEDVSSIPVQIELRDEAELREALEAGAESVRLVGMAPDLARRCVDVARGVREDCVVEIAAGITLQNVRAYAESGADYLVCKGIRFGASVARLQMLVESVGEK